MRKTLCKALYSILENEGIQEDLIIVVSDLKNLIKRVSENLTINLRKKLNIDSVNLIHEVICNKITKTSLEDCLQELTLNILEKLVKVYKQKPILKDELLNEKLCKKYIVTILKNYLIDLWRYSQKEVDTTVEIKNSESTDGKTLTEKISEGEILTKEQKEIMDYEIGEILEVFKKEVPLKNIKYFCYHLIREGKKDYKCLWGSKSTTAIYQDAKRKKKIVIAFLEKLKKLGFTYEVVEQFIRTKLSEICEEIRSKNCKEL